MKLLNWLHLGNLFVFFLLSPSMNKTNRFIFLFKSRFVSWPYDNKYNFFIQDSFWSYHKILEKKKKLKLSSLSSSAVTMKHNPNLALISTKLVTLNTWSIPISVQARIRSSSFCWNLRFEKWFLDKSHFLFIKLYQILEVSCMNLCLKLRFYTKNSYSPDTCNKEILSVNNEYIIFIRCTDNKQ